MINLWLKIYLSNQYNSKEPSLHNYLTIIFIVGNNARRNKNAKKRNQKNKKNKNKNGKKGRGNKGKKNKRKTTGNHCKI
jgi:hypothetical protein